MTTPEFTFTPGRVVVWDHSRGRGVLHADDDPRDVVADLVAFEHFHTTIYPGLAVQFRSTATPGGLRAVTVRPATS